MLLIGLRRHPVDAGGPVFAGPPIRLVQPVVIQVVVQRDECPRRMLPGQFCYPSLFRGHGIRLLCTWRVSLRRFYHLVSPSLPWVLPGGVSQVHAVLCDTTTSPYPYPTTYGFVARLQPQPSSSLGQVRGRFLPPGSLFPVRRRGTVGLGWEYGDLTGSWDAPPVPLPCSLTPAGPPHPTVSVLRCCPRTQYDEGSRGLTISGLHHTALAPLSTLHGRTSRRRMQDSLAAGGEPLPRGS